MSDNKPTDDELNRFLHEKVMGKHWHEWTDVTREIPFYKYECACGEIVNPPVPIQPNYCQSLDAVRAVELVVIANVTYPDYIAILTRLCPYRGFVAEARIRAEACYAAMKEKV